MKATSININALGEVYNPISAQGFRLEDDHGAWIEARVVDGRLSVAQCARCYECDQVTKWLAPDSRCHRCTRLVPSEVGP